MSSLMFDEERRPSLMYEEDIIVRRRGLTMTVRAVSLYVSNLYTLIANNYICRESLFFLSSLLILELICAATG